MGLHQSRHVHDQRDASLRRHRGAGHARQSAQGRAERLDDHYSGKFNLRVGEALHRRLAIEAAEEKLSINQLIVRRLNTAS